jgi:hypothetical protein
VRLVEEDAFQIRMLGQQERQERVVPAADVDDRPEATEVLGLEGALRFELRVSALIAPSKIALSSGRSAARARSNS